MLCFDFGNYFTRNNGNFCHFIGVFAGQLDRNVYGCAAMLCIVNFTRQRWLG